MHYNPYLRKPGVLLKIKMHEFSEGIHMPSEFLRICVIGLHAHPLPIIPRKQALQLLPSLCSNFDHFLQIVLVFGSLQ